MNYPMTEGIQIRNTKTNEIGTALEYSYSSMLVYRVIKSPDVVIVNTPNGQQVWPLIDVEPLN